MVVKRVEMTREEREGLEEGWLIVSKSAELTVERALWGIVMKFGKREYVTVVEFDDEEVAFFSYEQPEAYRTERNAWREIEQRFVRSIESQRRDIVRQRKALLAEQRKLQELREAHLKKE